MKKVRTKIRMKIDYIKKIMKNGIQLKYNNKTFRRDKNRSYEKGEIVFIKENGNNIVYKNLYNDAIDYFDEEELKNTSSINEVNLALKINKFNNKIANYDIRTDVNIGYCNEAIDNITGIVESIQDRYDILCIEASVLDRIIVGLGGQSVFETDMTLHNTYGIPYIPGQAIKGVLRNYIIKKYFETENCAMENDIFTNIFGGSIRGKSCQGKVLFFDSYPTGEFRIGIDIMTPHHINYYSEKGNDLPLDNDDVNPIKFLVLENKEKIRKQRLKFKFFIAIDKSIAKNSVKLDSNLDNNIKVFIRDNFIESLEFNGIGAKTSVGYGFFDKFDLVDMQQDVHVEKVDVIVNQKNHNT